VHPLQDSGRRKQELLEQAKRSQALQDKLLKEKLMQARSAFGVVGTSQAEVEGYKTEMGKVRASLRACVPALLEPFPRC
jgi:hypothetical protein